MAEPPRSREEAIAASQRGQRLKYMFFWGHRPSRGGVGPGCLSQWQPAPFREDGGVFRSAEHFMMVHKALLFSDSATAAKVLAAAHPGEAKQLGRDVQGFDEKIWEQNRYEIVVRGNLAKFGQHPQLREYLLGTRDRVLVEASPLDRIWGIGLAADDQRAADPEAWPGLNLLGFALMDVRDRLTP